MDTKYRSGMSIPEYMKLYLEEKLYEYQPDCCLEFGTGYGIATEILARNSKKVVTYEMFPEFVNVTKNRIGNLDNIDYRLFTENIFDDDCKYDMVFIDGPKGCPNRTAPFLYQWNNIKSGAHCLFDDANQPATRALLEYLKKVYKIEYNINNKERGFGEFVK